MNFRHRIAIYYLRGTEKLSGVVPHETMRKVPTQELGVLMLIAGNLQRLAAEFLASVHDEMQLRDAPWGRCACGCGCPLAKPPIEDMH